MLPCSQANQCIRPCFCQSCNILSSKICSKIHFSPYQGEFYCFSSISKPCQYLGCYRKYHGNSPNWKVLVVALESEKSHTPGEPNLKSCIMSCLWLSFMYHAWSDLLCCVLSLVGYSGFICYGYVFAIYRFWVTWTHPLLPAKLIFSNLPTDGWVHNRFSYCLVFVLKVTQRKCIHMCIIWMNSSS